MWLQLFLFVLSSFVQAALAPKPPKPKAAGIGEIDVATAEEGRPIPVIFGTVLLKSPNIVWYGDLYTTKIRTKRSKK